MEQNSILIYGLSLALAFVLGTVVGISAKRKHVAKIRETQDQLTLELNRMRSESRDLVIEQISACTDRIRDLYAARQEDVGRYTNALNASCQLVNEMLSSLSQIEAYLGRNGFMLPSVQLDFEAMRQVGKEMRGILSSVSFEDLTRCLAALKKAEALELSVYHEITKRAEDEPETA
jgi:predicted KAP-like P-loop ATPase